MRHEEDNVDTSISTLTNTIITLNFSQMFLFANNSSKQATEFLSAIIITKNKLIEERNKKSKLRYATLGIVKYIENEQKKARYAKLRKNAIKLSKGLMLCSVSSGAGIAANLVINGINYLAVSYPETFTYVKNRVTNFFWDTTSKPNQAQLKWKNLIFTTAGIATTVVLIAYCYEYSGVSRWIYKDFNKKVTTKLPEILPILIQDIIDTENVEAGKSIIPFVSREKSIFGPVVTELLEKMKTGNALTYFLLSTEEFRKISTGNFVLSPYNAARIVKMVGQLYFQSSQNEELIQQFGPLLSQTTVEKLSLSKNVFGNALNLINKNNKNLFFIPTTFTNTLPILKTISDPLQKSKLIGHTVNGLVNTIILTDVIKNDC